MAARDEAAGIIMNIMANAGVVIGATQKVIEEKGAKGALTAAKEKVLAMSIIQGPKKTIGFLSKMTKSLGGTFGIQFSMASILKQSQIFTGALGSVFQILGAFVDVILAPFMPLFVRLVRRMVSWIPLIQEKAEQAAEWLENSWIRNKESVTATLAEALFTGLKNAPWKQIGSAIFNNPVFLGAMTGMLFGPLLGGGLIGARGGALIGAGIGLSAVRAGVDFQDQAVGHHLSEAVNADYAYNAIRTRSFSIEG